MNIQDIINSRNKSGVKDSINCYLTINDVKFYQWSDQGTKKEAIQEAIKVNNQGHKTIIRKIDKIFYRVYYN